MPPVRSLLRGMAAIGEGMAMIGEGMASAFDLGGVQARAKLGSFADDRAAIARDWEAVGQDLWAAMEEFEAGLTEEQKLRLRRDRQAQKA